MRILHSIGLVLCLFFVAAGPVAAQNRSAQNLSAADARRLEAFVLTENLIDFADRTKSPQAYLMAAQLLLKYPTSTDGRNPKPTILDWINKARKMAPTDESVAVWANELERAANKTERGSNEVLTRLDVRLMTDESFETTLEPKKTPRTVLLACRTVKKGKFRLELLDLEGNVLKETDKAWLYFESETAVKIRLTQLGRRTADYTLLIR